MNRLIEITGKTLVLYAAALAVRTAHIITSSRTTSVPFSSKIFLQAVMELNSWAIGISYARKPDCNDTDLDSK